MAEFDPSDDYVTPHRARLHVFLCARRVSRGMAFTHSMSMSKRSMLRGLMSRVSRGSLFRGRMPRQFFYIAPGDIGTLHELHARVVYEGIIPVPRITDHGRDAGQYTPCMAGALRSLLRRLSCVRDS